jgi:putative transposase
VPLHIVQRGHNREPCFFAEEDYSSYLHWLGEALAEFDAALHAYVLMTNHVHLLLTPDKANSAALLMKNLGQRFVQYVNRVYRRSGTLWEGRFRSCLTQTEDYVLTCYRYIELNPVRAAMVRHPRDYRWSSYAANAEGRNDKLVTPHDQYLRLGRTDADRRDAYRVLFKAHIDGPVLEQIRQATNGNHALGNERFHKEVEVVLGKRAQRGNPGRPRLAPQ